jgi:N-acetylneuraminate synthase
MSFDINLLKDKYGDKSKTHWFSGHHLGIAVDIAAYTLGANIERHYTMDLERNRSCRILEPMGLRKLSRDLHAVHSALSLKNRYIAYRTGATRQIKNKKHKKLTPFSNRIRLFWWNEKIIQGKPRENYGVF